MTDSPEYDAQVKHSIYVERYKTRIANEIKSLVSGVSDDLYKELAASDFDNLTRRQLNRLLNQVEQIIKDGYGDITDRIEATLHEFAPYEAQAQSQILDQTNVIADLRVPSDADLWAAVEARPFEGKYLAGWLDALPVNTATRVKEAIQQGYVDGLGPLEIARQIRGTRTRQGVMDISSRGAEAMVRTAMAHTAAMATQRTYQGRRGITHEYWVSVLDHRTSAICRSLSGKFFEKGKGPYPPQHIGCRSRRIAATKGNMAKLKEVETYQQWLKRQSAETQDDILGVAKGKLFRDGGLTVDRFVDQSGQEYTLDQLKAKDKAVFDEVFGG